MEALSQTVATLENPARLVPILEGMGRRHVSYGVKAEDYDTVIEALLRTLERFQVYRSIPTRAPPGEQHYRLYRRS
jgi:hemoglobin-like flavoprotein